MLEAPSYTALVTGEDMLGKFVADMSQGLLDYDEICARYGFINRAVLFYFCRSTPGVDRLIRQHKAAYSSQDNVEQRIRLKAGLAVEAAIPFLAQIVSQPTTPIGQRIEGFHKLMRAAGTDGAPAVPKWGDGAASGGGGTTFTLNFIWSDGRRETVLTGRTPPPVIEHDTASAA